MGEIWLKLSSYLVESLTFDNETKTWLKLQHWNLILKLKQDSSSNAQSSRYGT